MKLKKLPCGFLAVTVVVLGVSLCGCSKTDDKKSAADADRRIVLQINDRKIDAGVLEKYLTGRPIPTNADNARELLKKRVDALVVEELFYEEALRLKLDQVPEIRQRIRELLTQKLFEELIQNKVKQLSIGQPELQSFYDAHQQEFNRPEEVRVADIFIAVPKDASDEHRAELKQKAQAVLGEVLALANRRAGFEQLVRQYSDQPEKYAKGDTGFFDAAGKPGGMDPRIVEAAFKLENNGDISSALIEAGDGYHILMQSGKRPAFSKSLEQVSKYMESRIRNEALQNRRDALIQELKAKAKIVTDEKALSQIREKLTPPQKMGLVPMIHQFLPVIAESARQASTAKGEQEAPPPATAGEHR